MRQESRERIKTNDINGIGGSQILYNGSKKNRAANHARVFQIRGLEGEVEVSDPWPR